MTSYKQMTADEKRTIEEQYRMVWGRDEKMVRHCVSSTSNYFTSDDGIVVTFDKPHIQKQFWFGEHNYEDRTEEAAAAEKSVDFFIRENTAYLKSYKSTPLYRSAYHYLYIKRGEYVSQPDGCALGYIEFGNCNGEGLREDDLVAKGFRRLTESEAERLYEAEDRRDALFMKRLQSYLKRYGLSKVSCDTFWADR